MRTKLKKGCDEDVEEAECYLQECPPELAESNDDYYSEVFSNTSKALLNRRRFWNETLVRKSSEIPETSWAWGTEYYLMDYVLKGSNSELITKVFVAEELGDTPKEFNTLQGSMNDTLFFGILDMYNSQVFFFVMHPNDWFPSQSHFEESLAPFVRETLLKIPPGKAGSIVSDSSQYIPDDYIYEAGYLRKI